MASQKFSVRNSGDHARSLNAGAKQRGEWGTRGPVAGDIAIRGSGANRKAGCERAYLQDTLSS
jgi:hypothetical protein